MPERLYKDADDATRAVLNSVRYLPNCCPYQEGDCLCGTWCPGVEIRDVPINEDGETEPRGFACFEIERLQRTDSFVALGNLEASIGSIIQPLRKIAGYLDDAIDNPRGLRSMTAAIAEIAKSIRESWK